MGPYWASTVIRSVCVASGYKFCELPILVATTGILQQKGFSVVLVLIVYIFFFNRPNLYSL